MEIINYFLSYHGHCIATVIPGIYQLYMKSYWNNIFHFHYLVELWAILPPVEKPYNSGVLYVAIITAPAGKVLAWQS